MNKFQFLEQKETSYKKNHSVVEFWRYLGSLFYCNSERTVHNGSETLKNKATRIFFLSFLDSFIFIIIKFNNKEWRNKVFPLCIY